MLRLRSYERLLVENRRFRSNGHRLTQNFTQKGSPATNHSSSQKTGINVLSYGIKISIDLSSILSGLTRVTDRRADGQTEFSSLDRVCISCSAVKRKGKESLVYHTYQRIKMKRKKENKKRQAIQSGNDQIIREIRLKR